MAQAKIRIMPGRRAGITSAPRVMHAQKSSATFAIGAPVKVASSYLQAVAEVSSAGTGNTLTEVHASSLRTILGFAAGKAVDGETGKLGVDLIQDGVEFAGNILHGTAASAKLAAGKVLGTTVYLAKVTSGETHWGWSIEGTGFTSSVVKGVVTELIDPPSTLNGRILARITLGGALTTV